MTTPHSPCVCIGRHALQQLRASLERDTGLQAAAYLQEAGFASGQDIHEAFAAWVAEAYPNATPSGLAAGLLGDALSGFFTAQGWGALSVTRIAPAVLALDADRWAEAIDEGGAAYPTCHLTCGMLADFLGRVADEPVAVMEVECRSRGDGRCRFLAGAPETLGALYERMAAGMGYTEAIGV